MNNIDTDIWLALLQAIPVGFGMALSNPITRPALVVFAVVLVCIWVRGAGFVDPDTDPITDKELR